MTATVWVLVGWFYGVSIGTSASGMITISHIASEADCIALGQAIAGNPKDHALSFRCIPYTGRI